MSNHTDVERIATEVLSRLDNIGEWLQGSGTEVLAIYTKFAMWESLSFALGGVTLLTLACIPAWYARKCWIDREPGGDAHFVPLGLLTSALALFGTVIASGGVMRLAVPEFYAIQMLLNQVL